MSSHNLKQRITEDWDWRSREYAGRSDMYLQTEKQQRLWHETLHGLVAPQGEGPLDILDVGTGPGFLALQFARMGHRVSGLDLSPNMLEIAAKKAAQRQLMCTFLQGDAEALPFADHSFDVVANRHLLWTLPRPGKAIREWMRVLKPGGRLLIMDGDWTNRHLSRKQKLRIAMGHTLTFFTKGKIPWKGKGRGYDDAAHLLPFSGVDPGKVIALMEAAGLQAIEEHDVQHLLAADAESFPLAYRWSFIDSHRRFIVAGSKAE
ncbi:2-methoxy-6-polyprenyl-1,4-benzoquinol methylase, mitochondrial [Paenibacillus solanacearum]|uniref:2-methoxy-6-polyprenyl-1,4-benzoquinol methylase, mitochondrial n=1 Tax=Paenibacillus solanacearum TaxID=2048548 RepID=A0A916NJW6_9BACL|nr:methyltransferase domain-containing protein [Paenibacillus solanacearum]CAG7640407.1 2-methoxy-6-polyprenyl-1,4-benzoquinol methylase, mitochondrial [Paenibacillus solanacearum]